MPQSEDLREARARHWTRRWLMRAVYYAILMAAGCAWLVRNEQAFLPAFALQLLAGIFFTCLILISIFAGMAVGALAGRIHVVAGVVAGLIAGAGFFMGVGLLSTQIPFLGPAIDRIAAVIE